MIGVAVVFCTDLLVLTSFMVFSFFFSTCLFSGFIVKIKSPSETLSPIFILTFSMTPFIFDGIKSIYGETQEYCRLNNDNSILMRFQEKLSLIPKWNQEMLNDEVERITNQSQCNYIEDLITCVHIIQLKALTCVRVGQSEKNVDINIPKL